MLSKKPWSSHEDQKHTKDNEHSLTSVLDTPELRSQLTNLIANCTQTMRKTISDTFEASQTGQISDVTVDVTGDDALRNPNINPGTMDEDAMEKARKELERRQKELSAPKMQELKTAALAHFDAWRGKVVSRVGETVNLQEEAEAQKEKAEAESPQAEEKKLTGEDNEYEAVNTALQKLFPPFDTPLAQLPEDKKALVLYSMLLLLLSLENYSSHSRVLLIYITTSLKLPIEVLAENETNIAKGLLEVAQPGMSADEETKKKQEEHARSRKWKVGLASVAGAAVIGLTGGLAAPLLAAGIGTVMAGLGLEATAAAVYLGSLASSSVLVGGLFGAYGAGMTGRMMDKYAKEISDFAFIPVRGFHKPLKREKDLRRLRVGVGISGWVTDKAEVVRPWHVLSESIEAFALRWEVECLMELGNGMAALMKSAVWAYAKAQILRRTVLASLHAGLWPLNIIKVSKIVENPWSVAMARSDKAGDILADVLINKAQGERPVTLIGYSVGARLIYNCLESLAERKAFGLVESVVFLGLPAPSASADWRKIRSVVSGRVVNVYSKNDLILGLLYRTSSIHYGVAGLQPIEDVKGVQNVDVSDMVSGHTRYRYLTGSILKRIGFEDIDIEEVEREEAEMREMEELERKEREKKEKEGKDEDTEAAEIAEEVKEKNKEGMMGWAAEKLKISDKLTEWSKSRSRPKSREGEDKK